MDLYSMRVCRKTRSSRSKCVQLLTQTKRYTKNNSTRTIEWLSSFLRAGNDKDRAYEIV